MKHEELRFRESFGCPLTSRIASDRRLTALSPAPMGPGLARQAQESEHLAKLDMQMLHSCSVAARGYLGRRPGLYCSAAETLAQGTGEQDDHLQDHFREARLVAALSRRGARAFASSPTVSSATSAFAAATSSSSFAVAAPGRLSGRIKRRLSRRARPKDSGSFGGRFF